MLRRLLFCNLQHSLQRKTHKYAKQLLKYSNERALKVKDPVPPPPSPVLPQQVCEV